MSDWNEIKRAFREALIAAFNWHSLAIVLTYHCDQRLDRITSEAKGFDNNVDDVIADAVQRGWLEDLAKGALAENEGHTGLLATVPPILQGVEAKGKAYYQGRTADALHDPGSRAGGQSETTRQLKKVLDAAVKNEVSVGEETILLVLIRDQDSRGLYAVLELEPDYGLQEEDVRQSRPFKLYFPVDESGNLLPAAVEVKITSPGFDPPAQSRIIEVPPVVESDDELYPEEFVLTPLRTGTLRVIIEAYQQAENKRTKIGSKPISTLSLESRSRYAEWKVQSILFGGQSVTTLTIGGVHFGEGDVHIDGPVAGSDVHQGDVIEGDRKDVVSGQQGQSSGATDGSMGHATDDVVIGDNISGNIVAGGTGEAIGPGAPALVTAGAIPAADDAAKKTLDHLVGQLNDLLMLVADDQLSDAAAVAQLTQLLLDALSAAKPDATVVQTRGGMLQQTAQAFKDSFPQIVDIAERISQTAGEICNP